MEDVIFSIIVPIYNVEQYLELCLDSIVAQAFNSKEIICVEDCSTDDSLSVLLKYEKNEKIKIIRHEKNKGLSGARNTGIKHAQGKYILFVDSDDVLANNALEILYNAINEQEMDVVYFDFRKFVKKEKQKTRPMSALPQNHRAFGQRAVTSAAQEDMEWNIKLKPPAASLRAASAMCCRWQARLWALATSGVFPIWQPNTAAAFFFWFIWCSCSPLALH